MVLSPQSLQRAFPRAVSCPAVGRSAVSDADYGAALPVAGGRCRCPAVCQRLCRAVLLAADAGDVPRLFLCGAKCGPCQRAGSQMVLAVYAGGPCAGPPVAAGSGHGEAARWLSSFGVCGSQRGVCCLFRPVGAHGTQDRTGRAPCQRGHLCR